MGRGNVLKSQNEYLASFHKTNGMSKLEFCVLMSAAGFSDFDGAKLLYDEDKILEED